MISILTPTLDDFSDAEAELSWKDSLSKIHDDDLIQLAINSSKDKCYYIRYMSSIYICELYHRRLGEHIKTFDLPPLD